MIQDRQIQKAYHDTLEAMSELFHAVKTQTLIDTVRNANYEWLDTVKAALKAEGFEPWSLIPR